MFEARNDVSVSASYGSGATFEISLGATKLDITVKTNDVIMQVDEEYPSPFANPGTTETRLAAGFHSIPYETPVKGFRFKLADPAAPTNVDWRAYG